MKITIATVLLSCLFSSISLAGSIDPASVAKKKQTPQQLYLTAQEAYALKQSQDKAVLFVDVRTRAEVEFVGLPTIVDANIPYLVNDFEDWNEKKNRFRKVPNSNFPLALKALLEAKQLTKNSPIILMCRSGSRSSKAAKLLAELNYKNVYSIVEGFEGNKAKQGPNKGKRTIDGWKNANLPWTYRLDKDKMYFEEL